jgi:hypothetical protein
MADTSRPAVHISIFAGERFPAVFSTALSKPEQLRLGNWLDANPELRALADCAWELAEREPPPEAYELTEGELRAENERLRAEVAVLLEKRKGEQ